MELLELVECLGGGKEEKPGSWVVHCPAHDDGSPSLALTTGDRGIMLKCRAGCATEAVLAAAGLAWRDLFKPDGTTNGKTKKRLVETYSYTDENGNELYQVLRYDPKQFIQRRKAKEGEASKDGYIYKLEGVRRVPFHLPALAKGDKRRRVFVVEGEKDVLNLEKIGCLATTNSGGAEKWRDDYNDFFAGRNVTILPDNDEPGQKHAEQVARALATVAKNVSIFNLPNLPDKGDVSDWIAAGGTAEKLKDLLNGKASPAEPAEEIAKATAEEIAALMLLQRLNGKYSKTAAELLSQEWRLAGG